jgi:hypothetical protein
MIRKLVGLASLFVAVTLVLVACEREVGSGGNSGDGSQPGSAAQAPAPKVCLVPDVVGLSSVAAEIKIIGSGLQMVNSSDFDSSAPQDVVISQEPPAGTRLEPCMGDVTLVVSLGPEPQPTDMPETLTLMPSSTAPPVLTDTVASSPTASGNRFPQRFLSEGNIPDSTMLKVDVGSGTIHCLTSGPVCFETTCLPGGENRGSVVILLPRGESYTLTHMVPTQNWHGAYYGQLDQWNLLAEERISAMQKPGNCTDGRACSIVDVLVIGEEGIVAHYTVE